MSRPTAAECATARTRLAEAEEAYHALQIGGRQVSVRMGENAIEYSPADAGKLAGYVGQLRALVARCDGCGTRRMIGVIPTN